MKPAPFTYVAARSAEEAVAHLARYDGSARLLAGGQSLIPLMNLRMARPAALIDLGPCAELEYIRRDGDWIAIGPMTRQASVEHSALVQDCCPLVAKTMPYLGNPTIRNRGTIGGTLAHADRVAELPGVALALDAELIALGPQGRRAIPAQAFFVADLTTALRADEMLREIRFPVASKDNRCAFAKAANRHHDLAIVGIAVSLELDQRERCTSARIAAVGVAPATIRLRAAEKRLAGSTLDEPAFAEAAKLAAGEIDPEDDFHASAGYRRRVAAGMLYRALSGCEKQ